VNITYDYLIANPFTSDKPVIWIVIAGVAAVAAMIFLFATRKKK
jgi:LPXTG-motif cell wall-anchored protein